jgi:hypothetical protein
MKKFRFAVALASACAVLTTGAAAAASAVVGHVYLR